MSDDKPSLSDSIRWLRIDQIGDEFEAALRAGQQPQIEDWVAAADEALREALRDELANVEAEFLSAARTGAQRNSMPTPADNHSTLSEEQSAESQPVAAVTRLPQAEIGGHVIIEVIATGGMGVVYKARQEQMQRVVALKTFHLGTTASETEVLRFRAEAAAAGRLDHPGIVPVYECGQDGRLHYYTMALVDGKSLQEVLRDGVMAPFQAAVLIQQLAEALEYAHRAGVIHRDIKPGNVLIDSDGRPRITDFGLAKLDVGGFDPTGTGIIMGTPGYMPPEQALGRASRVGPEADVYGAGAVLYHCLTGRAPFQGSVGDDVRLQVIHDEPVRPRLLNRSLPVDLETICLKCLEKRPSSRYESARMLADDLQRFIDRRPILARPAGRITRMLRWCRRNPYAALSSGLAMTLLLLLITGVPLLMLQRQKTAMAEQERLQSAQLAQANASKAATAQYYTAISQVREKSLTPEPGWTWDALELLKTASESQAQERDPTELRSLIAKCLISIDARLQATFAENGFIRRMAFSPDGTMLAGGDVYGGGGNTVYVYRLGPRPQVERRSSSQEGGYSVSLARKFVIPSAWDYFLNILFPTKPGCMAPGIESVAFSPDGTRLAIGTRTGYLGIYDMQSEATEPELRIRPGRRPIAELTFSEDGRYLYGVIMDSNQLHRWDAITGELLAVSPLQTRSVYVITSQSQPSQPAFALMGLEELHKVHLETLEPVRLMHPDIVTGPLAIAPDLRVAAGLFFGRIALLDIATGRIGRLMVELDSDNVDNYRDVEFSGNGGTLVGAINPGVARLWDSLSGMAHCDITVPARSEVQIALNAQTNRLIVATDSVAKAYELRTPGLLKTYEPGDHNTPSHDDSLPDSLESPSAVLPMAVDDVTRFRISRDHRWLLSAETGVPDRLMVRRGHRECQVYRLRRIDLRSGLESDRWVFRSLYPSGYSNENTGHGMCFIEGTEEIAAAVEIPGELLRLDSRGITFMPTVELHRFSDFQARILSDRLIFDFPAIPDDSGDPEVSAFSAQSLRVASTYRLCLILHASRAPHTAEENFNVEVTVAGQTQEFTVDSAVLEGRGWHLLELGRFPAADCRRAGNRVIVSGDPSDIQLVLQRDQVDETGEAQPVGSSTENQLTIQIDQLVLVPEDRPAPQSKLLHFVDSHADGSISAVRNSGNYLRWSDDDSGRVRSWSDILNASPSVRAKAVGSSVCVMGFWNGQVFMQEGDAAPKRILGELLAAPGDSGDEISAISVTRDDRFAAVGCRSGNIQVFDLNRSSDWLVGENKQFHRNISAIAFNHDATLLASAAEDSSLSLWRHSSGNLELIFRLERLDNIVRCIEFTPDNQSIIYSCQQERGLRQIDLEQLNHVFALYNVSW